MKTIGTCSNCKWWKEKEVNNYRIGVCRVPVKARDGAWSPPHYGCVFWEDKHKPLDNYPIITDKDLTIADLKRENEAAFERIKELSIEMVLLGYDPTAKKKPEPERAIIFWHGEFPNIGDHVRGEWYCVETSTGTNGNQVIVEKLPRIE
tara:strand:- start:143 stop:589 length:447 start_codon:yes stop_codon:yes gene_type:complete